MTQEPIPESVLVGLEEVRARGETNMLARDTVIVLVDEIEDLDTVMMEEAAVWLEENESRYMEALTAMGERRGGDGS